MQIVRYVPRPCVLALMVGLTVLASCAPAPSPNATTRQSPSAAQPLAERTLTIVVRVEPASIAAKPLRSSFVKVKTTVRLFNAGLDMIDDHNQTRPYLAEAVPVLNSDSWRVLPDGRMETSYRLKANLTWHDGTPLTADDFVFAYQVYATPELGSASTPPVGAMENVTAPDDRTVVISWRRVYPYAGTLQSTGETSAFPPLPRHILSAPYQTAQWEPFSNHPYWTSEFIGAGPYRLERWEPGTLIEGSAFAGHALGRTKIDRVQVQFQSDQNAALANLLSGTVQMAADDSLGFQQGVTAKQEWAPRSAGSLLVTTDLWRAIYAQFRPDVASPAALLDVRVRRALAHAVDKTPLNEALYASQGIMAETILPPGLYPEAERAAAHYPYDLRRADQLLVEAGFVKPSAGVYTHPTQGKLSFELKVNASAQYENERSVVAAGWREAGVEVQEATLPATQSQDPVIRATFPAFYAYSTGLGERSLANFAASAIPSPDNRWTGNNRPGWASPEFDRLLGALNTTLEPGERSQRLGDAVRILSEELPAISLYYDLGAVAFSSALSGPVTIGPDASGLLSWNVYEWQLK